MPNQSRDFIVIFINGRRHEFSGPVCFLMLADFLRYHQGLTGTKIVCAEGDCGACTVLCYRPQNDFNQKFRPINACIVMLAQLDGCHLLTVEALKNGPELCGVQKSLVKNHGSQCGFCTPGFAMAISAMMEEQKTLTEQKVKNCLTGNLCRCTGYQPIIKAALCSSSGPTLKERYLSQEKDAELKAATAQAVHIIDKETEFFAPLTLKDAVLFKNEKDACLVGGATDVGVWMNKGKFSKKPLLSLHLVKELYDIKSEGDRIMVGARASLSELRTFIKDLVPELASFLNIFASPQIKNIGTLVGNIANGSPIGDTLAFMMVSEGSVHVLGEKARTISIKDLYLGYKRLALLPGEIITHASFLIPTRGQKLKLEKVSQRKDLDISTINAAFLLEMDQGLIKDMRIALGGVSATVIRLNKTEQLLNSQRLTPQIIKDAISSLRQEISPLSDLRGSSQYRLMLCENLLHRFLSAELLC